MNIILFLNTIIRCTTNINSLLNETKNVQKNNNKIIYKSAVSFLMNFETINNRQNWSFIEKNNEVLIFDFSKNKEINDIKEIIFMGKLLKNIDKKYFIGMFSSKYKIKKFFEPTIMATNIEEKEIEIILYNIRVKEKLKILSIDLFENWYVKLWNQQKTDKCKNYDNYSMHLNNDNILKNYFVTIQNANYYNKELNNLKDSNNIASFYFQYYLNNIKLQNSTKFKEINSVFFENYKIYYLKNILQNTLKAAKFINCFLSVKNFGNMPVKIIVYNECIFIKNSKTMLVTIFDKYYFLSSRREINLSEFPYKEFVLKNFDLNNIKLLKSIRTKHINSNLLGTISDNYVDEFESLLICKNFELYIIDIFYENKNIFKMKGLKKIFDKILIQMEMGFDFVKIDKLLENIFFLTKKYCNNKNSILTELSAFILISSDCIKYCSGCKEIEINKKFNNLSIYLENFQKYLKKIKLIKNLNLKLRGLILKTSSIKFCEILLESIKNTLKIIVEE